MPAVRQIKIPLAVRFWMPFFSAGVQTTLEQIRKSTNERNALLSYCECVCFCFGNPDKTFLAKSSYHPPKTWKEFFGDGEEFKVLGTKRGDLRKPPHGTAAGFAFHFDDSPVLVAKLLAQIARFNFDNPKHQGARLSIFQNFDPGAAIRNKISVEKMRAESRAKRLASPAVPKKMLREIKNLHPNEWREIVAGIENGTAIRRAQIAAEKPQPISQEDLKAAEGHHAEWHEIEKIMNDTRVPFVGEVRFGALAVRRPESLPETATRAKAGIAKAAHDEIKAREKILNRWPSIPNFVPPELLSTSIEVKS